jgi:acyl carrier protein
MDELEQQIKALIIDVLKLEDLRVEDIDSQEPLFGDGLGLDSIDALELGVALRKRYGLKIDTITDEVKAHFGTVRSLAAFIRSQCGGTANAVA